MSGHHLTHSYGGLAPGLVGTDVFFGPLALFIVVLRGIYARNLGGRLRWDFIWVACATVFGGLATLLWEIACGYGIGQEITKISSEDLFFGLKLVWIGIMMGIAALVFAKASIFALYLEIVTPSQKIRRWVLHGVQASYLILSIIQIFLVIFACSPSTKLWNILEPGACAVEPRMETFSYFFGGYSALLDFLLAFYPITIVWNLQASFKTKLGFCALMAGGVIPGIAAICRAVLTRRLFISTNPTHILFPFLIAASLECWFIIILGSVPPLRPVWSRYFSKARTLLSKTEETRHWPYSPASDRFGGIKGVDPKIWKLRDDEMQLSRDESAYIHVHRTFSVNYPKETKKKETEFGKEIEQAFTNGRV